MTFLGRLLKWAFALFILFIVCVVAYETIVSNKKNARMKELFKSKEVELKSVSAKPYPGALDRYKDGVVTRYYLVTTNGISNKGKCVINKNVDYEDLKIECDF